MIDIITSYTFIIAAVASVFLGVAGGMVGSVSVLKGQSLIGDCIGHSTYPGIILAFMLFQIRDPFILLIGAFLSGVVAFFLVQVINHHSKNTLDTSLAIVLSSVFGIGMALKSHIQGNSNYARSSQSGVTTYIFGQAALIREVDAYILAVVSIISVAILLIFYKEFKLYIFDAEYAQTIYFRPKLMAYINLIMTILLITAGIKTVGVILISSMIIIPTIVGIQWSNKYSVVIVIAGFTGLVSALVGTYLGSIKNGFPNGPAIILVMSTIAFVSMFFGTNGIVRKLMRRRKMNG